MSQETKNISFGGSLVRDLLASEEYILVNNSDKTKGGPLPRFDPANKENKSCLELVIISACLEPFIKELLIDSAGERESLFPSLQTTSH